MNPWGRLVVTGAVSLLAACALSSCGSSHTAGKKTSVKSIVDTTTTVPATSMTAATAATTTTGPGVAVPNVIGLKSAAARAALRAAGLHPVSLNVACNRGTLASQSVVTSLAVAGGAPNANVGAVPLSPGARVPPGTRVGITWSGCYGNGSPVPAIVGLTHLAARHALTAVGLAWACYSVGRPTTTTTTTTVKPPQTVLTQSPAPGTVLKPGAIVTFTMYTCPQ